MALLQPLNLFSRLLGLVGAGSQPPNPTSAIERQLARLLSEFNGTVTRLAHQLADGEIALDQFDAAMRTAIRRQHLAAAVVSAGGAHAATPDTYALAQRQVDTQMVYFDRWIAQLRANPPTPEQANALANRARMYGTASKQTVERGRAQALGVPTLPFYPKDRTLCKVGCCCHWDCKPLRGDGNYDCYWRLDPECDHCATCIARERTCSPLRVRGGVIQDAERYQAAALYA